MKGPNCDHSLSTSSGCDKTRKVPGVGAALSVASIGIKDRTDAIVRGLEFLVAHHGASTKLLSQLKEQTHGYLDTSESEAVWMKRCKYLLCYPLAKFLRNELPPCPDRAFEPTGLLRRWMKCRLFAFNRKNSHLWSSWLQVKRCALAVSEELVEECYKKHLTQLTKEDPVQNDEGRREIEKILSNPVFQKTLATVALKIRDRYENEFSSRTPSTSACFEATRLQGGQYGALKTLLVEVSSSVSHEVDNVVVLGNDCSAVEINDASLTYLRTKTIDQLRLEGKNFFSLGGMELVRMDLRTIVNGKQRYECVVSQYEYSGRIRWNELVDQSIQRLTTNEPHLKAIIQAVLEPLKVRIISKGNALEYYEMAPLQKCIHGVLREMNAFRLIGRRVCPTDFIDLLPAIISKENVWCSVDYSAATDGLSSYFGLEILDRILCFIPYEDRVRAGKVLGPHRLSYPHKVDGKMTYQERGLQTNGQLMGSILSFPILCLANLGVYLHTIRSSDESDLDRVLVNGDDMAYVGTDRLWTRHKKVAGRVGLEMSVGKAYTHRKFSTVNSTVVLFDLDTARTGAHPLQMNYLNCGLFFGQHKVQARAGEAASHHDFTGGVVANIDTILEGSLPGKQCELLRDLLQRRKAEIAQDAYCELVVGRRRRWSSYHRNLFLPTHLGGMGVTPPVGWKFAIKKIDRCVAFSRLESAPFLDERPTFGCELQKFVDPIPPWIKKDPASEPPCVPIVRKSVRKCSMAVQIPVWFNHCALLI